MPRDTAMITSPYDGSDRAILRRVLAVAIAIDLVIVAAILSGERASRLSHPLAPSWLLAFGGRPVLAFAVAGVAVVAAILFGSRPGRTVAGLTLLACGLLLNEALAAVVEGPMRAFFSSGATLAGWLVGSMYASGLGADYESPRAREAMAEIGACAALAATYVGAFASKTLAEGLSWADATALQSVVLQQHPIHVAGPLGLYFRLVVNHPAFALTLAATTLVAQASMLAYPWGRRGRAIAGTLVLAFHVNVALLTPIVFVGPMILLAVFSYPWPSWIARWRGRRDNVPSEPALPAIAAWTRHQRFATGALFAAVATVALLGLPARVYSTRHHEGRHEYSAPAAVAPAAQPLPSPEAVALLDGLHRGDAVGDYRVVSVEGPIDREIRVALTRDDKNASLTVAVRSRGGGPGEPPVATERFALFYGRVVGADDNERDAAMQAIAMRIRRVETRVATPPGM